MGIKSALAKKESMPRTWLLHGMRGSGKTTLAKIVSKEMGAVDTDIRELNISNTRGIDAARDIITDVSFAPLKGGKKVYLLNECQQASKDFQNAMLEVLEVPPKHVIFILCTTDPQKLIPTVIDRCKKATFKVTPLLSNKVRELLYWILKGEGIDPKEFPEVVINAIIKRSEGIPRNAISLLDIVIDVTDDNAALELIDGAAISSDEGKVLELCQGLMKSNKSWAEIRKILTTLKDEEPESLRYAVLEYFNKVLLNSDKNDAVADIIASFSESFIYSKRGGLSATCYFLVNK
jgi:DNA polymerase-3 subunit gamma/tau